MFIDTHCHLNISIKKTFDRPLTTPELQAIEPYLTAAKNHGVTRIINVGTSLIESLNCIKIANIYSSCFASVGIHPNDCTPSWREDVRELEKECSNQAHKIVAIGECGIDKHYEGFDIQRQKDAFCAQIELALAYDKAIIVHTRDAYDETLECLFRYKNEPLRGTIHCFSEDAAFAHAARSLGFVLGIGGTITYPKNQSLRNVVIEQGLEALILETDAPYLAPQVVRGKENKPEYIAAIAHYLAELLSVPLEEVARITTQNSEKIFMLNEF